MCYLFLIIAKYNISPPQGQTGGQREAAPVGTATPKKHMATT